MPRNGLGLHGLGFGCADCIVSSVKGVGWSNYPHHWHMASVAMAQFTIVHWSPATQVKTFANIAKFTT